MIDTILVPTDGSDEAAVAVDHGIELATRFNAAVHVLHVVDVRKMETAPDSDDARVRGQELVGAIAEEAQDQELSVTTAVLRGTPSERILQYASKEDLDLITMGTHGRTGVQRYLLGSVAEKVVRLSDIPVLTVRLSTERPQYFPYKNVLVPTDGSRGARGATDWAITVADAYGGTIHALSVTESAALGFDVRSSIQLEQMQGAAEDAVTAVVGAAHDAGLDATSTVSQGTPYKEILAYIDEHDIDIVVMGTHGRGDLDRYLLGSVAEKTVRTSPVPVMTIRPPDSD